MIIVTRNLSAPDLGVYYGTTAYPQLISRFFDLGLTHSCRYFILMVPSARPFIIKLILLFSLGVFAPIYLVFFLLKSSSFDTSGILLVLSQNYISLTAYCVLLLTNSILNSILLSLERFKVLLWVSTIPYIVFILVVLYKVFFYSLDVKDILIQLLISELLISAISLIGLMDLFKINKEMTSLKVREVFIYAIKIYPNSFLKPLANRLDRIVLSFIATPAFIGYYSVLMTLREVAILPVTTYGQVLMNKLSLLIKRGTSDSYKLMYKPLFITLLIYLAGFGIYFLFKDLVLHLFFKHVTLELYHISYLIFLSIIPLSLFSLLTYYYLVSNRPSTISWAIFIGIILFYAVTFLCFQVLRNQSFSLAVLISTTLSFGVLVLKLKR